MIAGIIQKTWGNQQMPFLTELHTPGLKRIFNAALVLLLLWPAAASADEFRLVPSLGVSGEYNSNVFFNTDGKTEDYLMTITPGLEIVNKTEKLDLNFKARGSQYLYRNETDLNSFDQFYDGAARYGMSEKWNLSASASYWRDSQPDREIMTSGLVLGRVKRDHQQYGVSSEHALTEKTSAALSYVYSSDNYDDDRFTDLTAHNVNLTLSYDIGRYIRNAKIRSNFGYVKYTATGIDVDNYIGTLGYVWNFHELWQLNLEAGARYTRSSFDVLALQFIPPFFFTVVTVNEKSEGWGGVCQAVFSYKGELSRVNFSYIRDVLPASGRSGASERNAFILDVSRNLTFELIGSLYASYFTNRSKKGEFAAAEINENTYSVGPRIRYEFTKDYALEILYSYTRVDYRVTDEDAQRNFIMVKFAAQWPLFE